MAGHKFPRPQIRGRLRGGQAAGSPPVIDGIDDSGLATMVAMDCASPVTYPPTP